MAVLVAQKSLIEHVQAVAYGLRMSLAEGDAVSMIVGDTAAMDQAARGVAGGMTSAAENFSDGVLAPGLLVHGGRGCRGCWSTRSPIPPTA